MKSNAVSILSLAAIFLTLFASGCASTGDKPRVRIYEEKQYIQLRHLPDTAARMNLQKGDATAMVCSKCKTVLYQRVSSPVTSFWYSEYRERIRNDWAGDRRRQAYENWRKRHFCPGCKSTITVTGNWLNGKETVKHTCDECGSDSVFCCATSKEALATEGMEPKSKP